MPARKKDRPRAGKAKFQVWLSVLEKREVDERFRQLCRDGTERADALLALLRGAIPALARPEPLVEAAELRRLQDCSDAWRLVAQELRQVVLPAQRPDESGVAWALRMIALLASEAGRQRRTRRIA